jgi:hypothetical protein
VGEHISNPPETLSNRRLFYETLVTGLRRASNTLGDASRITGQIERTGSFIVDDYFVFEHTGWTDATRPVDDVRREILESRQPIISIGCNDTDEGCMQHIYTVVRPEDVLEDSAFILPVLEEILPPGWPANEPFVYDMQVNKSESHMATFHPVLEPFTDPRLAAVYNAVAANL